MCGIAGKVSFQGPVDGSLVEAMCAEMVHRGPDAQGMHLDDGVALGVRRLRVVDLEIGDQPVYNEDGTVAVVLNGEIYNFGELRERLHRAGHSFSTRSDSEVIAHLYEERGDDLVNELDGMFAFAVWDSGRRRLLIARDRVGKKPLFYSLRGRELAFASELTALMTDRSIPRDLDPAALDAYLTYGYIPHPLSIWGAVRKLPPAHVASFDADGLSERRYWRLEYSPKLSGSTEELAEGLRTEIGAAVRRRMAADVPLGAFLSGGVDSSIVVAEMAAASPEPVKTFSIGFHEERFSELSRARQIAERFSTDHEELVVEPDAVELLPRLVRNYGEPFADSSAIPSFYLAEMTSRHVTVALNGDGGDESFAGYRRHLVNVLTGWADSLPRGLRSAIASSSRHLPGSKSAGTGAEYARRFLATLDRSALGRYRSHIGYFSTEQRRRLLGEAAPTPNGTGFPPDALEAAWSDTRANNRVDALLGVDVATYLPGDLLVKIDIATMAHSLEARSPLLDHHLMEYAAALPAKHKARRLQKKALLRDAYRGTLPEEILDGPKKGFAVPIGEWLRGPLKDKLEETVLDRYNPIASQLRPEAVSELITEHREGRADHGQRLWALLFLAEWGARPQT